MRFPAIEAWFESRGWEAAGFQREVWRLMAEGRSGLLHSSTGSGKTLAIWMGLLANPPQGAGIKALWITPLRSLASDTLVSLHEPTRDLGLDWKIELRTGDTTSHTKQKQLKDFPDALITTPESLTLLLSMRAAERIFQNLDLIVVDEWHELMGTKRGVQTELALARVRRLRPEAKVWGLSATLGNTQEAAQALAPGLDPVLVRGETQKEIIIDSVLPESVERFPWAGHIGLKMLPQVIEEIGKAESSLLFTNTRGQAELWHQKILEANPPWADKLALHHGSMGQEVRAHAEQGLKAGELKAVVCTSSLDLGVDFSPVERVFQIGSPKGVARLLQRAGRSGHRPGVPSRVTCVPTHAWELLDIAAVRLAADLKRVEARAAILNPLDVLAQHLVSMALSEGFDEQDLLAEVRTTHAFRSLSDEEWQWALDFVTRGGDTLRAYPEFRKVIFREGKYVVEDKRIAQRHRSSIGTIVSDPAIKICFRNGTNLGTVEESFVSRMKKGDKFVFAGRTLEFLRIKDLVCYVQPATKGKGIVPSWMGGRMPLTTELAQTAREKLTEVKEGVIDGPELQLAAPLLSLQAEWSVIPADDELLIERVESREGHHIFIFPIEGRLVHEGLAALTAYRLSRHQTVLFSIACNDYGFELLSDHRIDFDEAEARAAFSLENLAEDILHSLNSSELARRQFREIARIAGLIFSGYPGQQRSARQIQSSSGLLFDVFSKYDPGHPLLKQADREVLDKHLEQTRLRACLERISQSRLLFTEPPRPTPIAFPILVDRLRETVGSETFSQRIERLVSQLEEEAGDG